MFPARRMTYSLVARPPAILGLLAVIPDALGFESEPLTRIKAKALAESMQTEITNGH